jgi:anaerobic selenocysteine-containing dehydrogenase
MEGRTHLRTCPLCEAMCGLAVHTDGDRVTAVRPDPDDVWSRGYVCPKGTTLGALHHDPDRIRVPMVREGNRWRDVGWDEALARCEDLLGGVLATHGKQAVTAYIGNPTAHSIHLSRYVGLFMGLAQLPTLYSAGTVDQWPKNVACMLMYGGMWWIPTPDVRRTHYWVIMGGNPEASQVACSRVPTCSARSMRFAGAGAKRSSSIHGAPARPRRRTSGSRSSPAPTRRSCWRSATSSSPTASCGSAISPAV